MQKTNYDKITDEIIKKLRADGIRKRLLLHACCAPCASACIERLKDDFDLTVYFYNPNMDCDEEYLLRLKEAQRLCNEFGVGFLCEEFIHQDFLDCVKGFECALEGGARCQKCFDLRLKKTAEKAKELLLLLAKTLNLEKLQKRYLFKPNKKHHLKKTLIKLENF